MTVPDAPQSAGMRPPQSLRLQAWLVLVSQPHTAGQSRPGPSIRTVATRTPAWSSFSVSACTLYCWPMSYRRICTAGVTRGPAGLRYWRGGPKGAQRAFGARARLPLGPRTFFLPR